MDTSDHRVFLPDLAPILGKSFQQTQNLFFRYMGKALGREGSRWYIHRAALNAVCITNPPTAAEMAIRSYHRLGCHLEAAREEFGRRQATGMTTRDLEGHIAYLEGARAEALDTLRADQAEAQAARDATAVAIYSLILALLPRTTYTQAGESTWTATLQLSPTGADAPAATTLDSTDQKESHHGTPS